MKKWFLICSLAALFSCVAFGGNIVVNPGFETGDYTGWTSQGWYVETTSGGVVPHSGTYYSDTGCVGAACIGTGPDGAFFYQNLPTTNGQTYTISFWYDLGNTVGESTDDFAELQVQWGGTTFLDVTATDQADAGWVNYTTNELAASTSTQLEFFGRQDPSQMGIDDVCVDLSGGVCGPGATVPEPASLLLSLSGFAGLGLLAIARRLFLRPS